MKKIISDKYSTYLMAIAIRFSKFASVGVFCAVFNLSSNFVLLKYFQTALIPTYTGIYIISILVSFLLNSKFTFKNKITLRNLITYYSIYLSAMVLGIILLSLYNYFLSFESWVYPFMVTPITMCWNFFNASRTMK